MAYDDKERRIWCSDCEMEVEPFDAFMYLVEVFDGGLKDLNRRRRELHEAEQFALRSRAARVMDEAWRSTKMAPLCPHCNAAILPEDVVKGVAMASKQLIIARRKKQPSA